MTGDLQSLYAYLYKLLPADFDEIMGEMREQHQFNPTGSQGLPADALALAKALRSLEKIGRLEQRDGRWWWKDAAAKAEPQLLF